MTTFSTKGINVYNKYPKWYSLTESAKIISEKTNSKIGRTNLIKLLREKEIINPISDLIRDELLKNKYFKIKQIAINNGYGKIIKYHEYILISDDGIQFIINQFFKS